MKKIPVVLYLRSAVKNNEATNTNDIQKAVLKNYCEKNNYVYSEIFEDYASGANFNREGWSNLISYLKAYPDIKQILISHIDRFSRSLKESIIMVNQLSELGITIYATEQKLDLTIFYKEMKNSYDKK